MFTWGLVVEIEELYFFVQLNSKCFPCFEGYYVYYFHLLLKNISNVEICQRETENRSNVRFSEITCFARKHNIFFSEIIIALSEIFIILSSKIVR